MPIAVVCNGCGKQYRVADQAAGKKLRCRECGQEMIVPREGSAAPARATPPRQPPAAAALDRGEEDAFEALVAMERDAGAATRPAPASRRAPAFIPPPDPLAVADEPGRAKEKRRRPPGRFGRRRAGGAGADSLTPWLVIAFVVAQLAAAIVQTVQAGHVSPQAHGKVVGTVWTVGILHIVLLFAVLGPAVWLGVFIASMILNFRMVDLGYLRGCAIAALPGLLILATTFVPAGLVSPLVMAGVLGVALLLVIPLGFLVLRTVFDLDWVGSAVAYLFSGPLYVAAATLASNVLTAAVLAQVFHGASPQPSHFFDRDEFARVPQAAAEPEKPDTANPTPSSPGNAQAELEAKKTQTQDNLRQIGQAIQRYAAADERGLFPPALEALTTNGALPPGCLNSPFQRSKAGGYFYWPGRSSTMPPNVAVAYDAAELSAQGGTYVLFANGNVEWRDAPSFASMEGDSNRAILDWQAQQQREAERKRQAEMAAARPPQPSVNPSQSQADQAPPVPKPQEFVARFNAGRSPFVASVKAVPFDTEPRAIIAPATPSPWAAVVHGIGDSQDQVEVWDLAAGQKKADAAFTHEAGFQSGYAINPTGTLLARTANFPKLGVRIWSVKEQRETRTIPLNEALGTPMLAGFLDGERLAVLWNRGSEEGFEVWNVVTGMRARQVPLQPYLRSVNNGVFSPDGRTYAMTTAKIPLARMGVGRVAHVEFYDLFTATNWRRWREIDEVSAADVDTPAGMAFSPDGKRLAALFAKQGSGFIQIWRVGDLKPVGGYEVAVAPDAVPDKPTGPGLAWVHNGAALLVLGNVLVDASTGKMIGQLNAPPSTGQRVLANDTLAFAYDDAGKSRLAIVKLDPAPLGSPTTSAAPLSATPAR